MYCHCRGKILSRTDADAETYLYENRNCRVAVMPFNVSGTRTFGCLGSHVTSGRSSSDGHRIVARIGVAQSGGCSIDLRWHGSAVPP